MRQNIFLKRRFKLLLYTSAFAYFCYCFSVTVNSIITGMFYGEAGLAGVEIFNSAFYAVEFLAEIFGVGGTILYSKASGRYNKEEMTNVFSLALEFTIGVGLLAGILMFNFVSDYVSIFALGKRAQEIALDYGRFFCILILLHPIKIVLNQFVFMDGNVQICNVSSITYLILGSLLPYILGKSFGVKGIILGSIIATLIVIIILSSHLFLKKCTLKFKPYFNLKYFPSFFKYSILDASNALYGAIGMFVLHIFILRFFSESVLAIFAVAASVIDLEIMFDSVGSALGAIYNNYAGEKNYKCLDYTLKISTKSAIIFSMVFACLMFMLAPLYVKLFGLANIEVIANAITAVRITVCGAIGSSLIYLISSYYLLIDKIALGSFVIFLRDFICLLALLPLLSLAIGSNGLWLGFALTPFITLICLFVLILIKYNISDFPFFKKKYDKDTILVRSFILNEDELEKLWKDAKKFLEKNNVDSKTANKILMLLEELPLIILEKNNKKILFEADIIINENINVIIRDNGILFDITDTDSRLKSFREFVASCLISRVNQKDNLITLSCNRSMFRF